MFAGTISQEPTLDHKSGRRCSLRIISGAVFLAAFAFGLMPSGAARATDRVALLLCVEDYQNYQKSGVQARTCERMGGALAEQGFAVDVMVNANNAVARATLRSFAQKTDGSRVAIVVLAGHGAGARGQFYLLPSNARIERASDLLSRGVALSSVAHITSRAKHGAVFFFSSAADIPSTVDGVSLRPSLTKPRQDNVVAVLSTSDKVPVSRVDSVSRQAALDFADAAAEKPLTLADLIASGSAGEMGQVAGPTPEIDLSSDERKPEPKPAAPAQPSAEEIAAREEAERRASDAERRAREAEERAREAEARAREETAKAEAAEKAAEQREAAAEREVARIKEEPPKTEPEAPAAKENDVDALKLVEALLGRSKKKLLQRRMKALGFYEGPIDAIFGDLTRQGIRDYQKSAGETATGYLTPEQIQNLIENS